MVRSATRFLVVRHGQTRWNVDGRIQGHLDSRLTAAGRGQAMALAARFARQRRAGDGVDAIYASDLGRARETAAPIARAMTLTPRFDARLRERSYGALESLTWGEIETRHPEPYARLAARDPEYVVPGGESATAFRDRILAAFADIAAGHAGRSVAVVTHGGVLNMLYRAATATPLHAPRTFSLENASVNAFSWRDGALALEQWGDVSHLPEAREDGADSRN